MSLAEALMSLRSVAGHLRRLQPMQTASEEALRAFLRRFGMCRICFRELALNGFIPGVRKASW